MCHTLKQLAGQGRPVEVDDVLSQASYKSLGSCSLVKAGVSNIFSFLRYQLCSCATATWQALVLRRRVCALEHWRCGGS